MQTNNKKTPEQATYIASLVRRLVLSVTSAQTQEASSTVTTKQIRLALRLLSSRLSSSKQSLSENQVIIERIKRSLCKRDRVRDAFRFLELANSLEKLVSSYRAKTILFLLEELEYHQEQKKTCNIDLDNYLQDETAESSSRSQTMREKGESLPKYSNGSVRSNETAISDESSKIGDINGDIRHNSSIRQEGFQEYMMEENASYEISEAVLVREVIYTIQGIDGKYIKYNPKIDEYCVIAEVGVPQPARELIRRVSKLGWIYKYMKQQLESIRKSPSFGVLTQSFCVAIENELDEYYEMLAEVEAQAGMTMKESIENAGLLASKRDEDLTLRKLFVWSQEPLERLKWLTVLIDTSKGLKGSEILSTLHLFTLNGDFEVRRLVSSVMQKASLPLYESFRKWVLDGELDDPHEEFFIAMRHGVSTEDIWEKKFYIRQQMIPSFLASEQHLLSSILLAGKTVVFLRKCCSDSVWLSERFRDPRFRECQLVYNDIDTLRSFVKAACEISSSRLKYLFFEKFMLKAHCVALRNLILLGQGDFVQNLLDSLSADLNESSSNLYRNNLLGTLDAALRSSSAASVIANAVQVEDAAVDQLTNDILDRMDVRLLHPSSGAQGWDIFSLDYRVDVPLTSIFTKDVMEMYRRISRFLWHLKRADFLLSSIWSMHLAAYLGKHKRQTALSHLDIRIDFLRMKMIHFVNNLQYYVMFEVLEISWNELLHKLNRAADLDQLIYAQRFFISRILEKLLLKEKFKEQHRRIRQLLEIIVRCHSLMQQLYCRLSCFIQKSWTMQSNLQTLENEKIDEWLETLEQVEREYDNTFQEFIQDLQTIEKDEIRPLLFRLNFNGYYSHQSSFLNRNYTNSERKMVEETF
eukprot:jgi/Galph1/4197/GphlegSOOS_G2851.1